jgi:hypothetical protein
MAPDQEVRLPTGAVRDKPGYVMTIRCGGRCTGLRLTSGKGVAAAPPTAGAAPGRFISTNTDRSRCRTSRSAVIRAMMSSA